jgi:hypothetical protein
MSLLSNPAFGPRVALIYVTAGALIDVWTAVYYFAFARGRLEENSNTWFWVVGLFCTGLTLIVLGLLLGPLGRAARKAELPPDEALPAESQLQHAAATTPHPVVVASPTAGASPNASPQPAPPVAGVPAVATTSQPRL